MPKNRLSFSFVLVTGNTAPNETKENNTILLPEMVDKF